MRIEPAIFKAYDIRGIYPAEINTAVTYELGRAFANLLQRRNPGKRLRIAVGCDMRLSSPELKTYFMNGVAESGVDVDDIGRVSSPTFYFATAFFKYDGGAQISASHNPKEWNGIKLVGSAASPIGKDSGLSDMQKMIEQGDLTPLVSSRGNIGLRSNVLGREMTEQRGIVSLAGDKKIKPFRIAIDAGNGMGGEDMAALFQTLPCGARWMNEVPDGNFPAHPPDPMVEENTRDLRAKIVSDKCDLGIAIDGDADRYFFFDEKGHAVPSEILRGIMAQIELSENPGATVVYDARPGKITTDLIEEAGGRGVQAPVGHSRIKKTMLSEDAVFGGESSGHYFYKLPYGTFEAPIVLVVKFLEYLSKQDKPLSEIVAPFKKYWNSGEINTKLANQDIGLAVIETIKQKYSDGTQSFVDGLSIEYPDFWFTVRLSNTEPLIRFIIEARTKEMMEKRRDEILGIIRAVVH